METGKAVDGNDPKRREPTDMCDIETNEKTAQLQVRPDFQTNGIYLHPIPERLQEIVKDGERWAGWFGRNHDTGKKDKHGVPIYVRYFIPVRKVA